LKKLSAILLLALLLFNLAGYRLVFELLQAQHKVSLEASLDKNQYHDDDLLEIRVPFSMPYQPDETSYERVDGEITVNGQSYKYVKRKVEKGHLILLCIPDHRKTGIEQAKTEFGGGVNDYPLTGKKGSDGPGKNVGGSEYEETLRQLVQAGPAVLQLKHFDNSTALLTPGFPRFAERPPQDFLS
jgi:hypothetical protein